jgi:hypothetical protein
VYITILARDSRTIRPYFFYLRGLLSFVHWVPLSYSIFLRPIDGATPAADVNDGTFFIDPNHVSLPLSSFAGFFSVAS